MEKQSQIFVESFKNNANHLGLLCVEGIDAKKFLQGQLTCNLDEVSTTQTRMGAHCNPQGRVISLFHLIYTEERYYLQMQRAMVPIALAALKKYAIFFKVTLSDVSDQWKKLVTENTHLSAENKQHFNFEENIPTIYPETSEKFLPHEINLPQLEAISFNKGCYTGQEIIARMHYRGKAKSQLRHGTVQTESVPQRGADIYDQTNVAGMVVDYYQTSDTTYELQIVSAKTENLFLDSSKCCLIAVAGNPKV